MIKKMRKIFTFKNIFLYCLFMMLVFAAHNVLYRGGILSDDFSEPLASFFVTSTFTFFMIMVVLHVIEFITGESDGSRSIHSYLKELIGKINTLSDDLEVIKKGKHNRPVIGLSESERLDVIDSIKNNLSSDISEELFLSAKKL